jgi:transposase
MEELTALEIKEKLIEDGILNQENKATILMDFLNIKAEKINRDLVGSMMETWLEEWFVEKDIYFRKDGTQTIPDFYINKKKAANGMCFLSYDYSSSPRRTLE